MVDREKVIKALSICVPETQADSKLECSDCPYGNVCNPNDIVGITLPLIWDIRSLLKEQEAVEPKGHWIPYEPDKRGYTDGFTCSRCERVILSDHFCKMIDFDFCPYCGAYMDNAEGW